MCLQTIGSCQVKCELSVPIQDGLHKPGGFVVTVALLPLPGLRRAGAAGPVLVRTLLGLRQLWRSAAPEALPPAGTACCAPVANHRVQYQNSQINYTRGMSQDPALKAEESWKARLGSDLQSPSEKMPVLAQSPLVQPLLLLLFLLINCSVHQHAGSALDWLSGHGCGAPGPPLLHAVTVSCGGCFCGDRWCLLSLPCGIIAGTGWAVLGVAQGGHRRAEVAPGCPSAFPHCPSPSAWLQDSPGGSRAGTWALGTLAAMAWLWDSPITCPCLSFLIAIVYPWDIFNLIYEVIWRA